MVSGHPGEKGISKEEKIVMGISDRDEGEPADKPANMYQMSADPRDSLSHTGM